MISVKLGGNFRRDAEKWLAQLEADAAKAIVATVKSCEVDMKAHAPVAPIHGGELRESVRSGTDGLAGWVTAGGQESDGQVGWNEYGTYKMAAQPFVRPAADRAKGTFERNLRGIR